jgi:hypothetical protein
MIALRFSNVGRVLTFVPIIVLGQQAGVGGQQKGEAAAAPASITLSAPSPESLVPANIILIGYHCKGKTNEETCIASVGKQEFDRLVQAIDANMPPAQRLSLAAEYARLVIMASEAQRMGIDKSSEAQTLEKFSRLQVLANQLVKRITANPPEVPAEAIQTYFRDHLIEYSEVVLSRLVILSNPSSHAGTRSQPDAGELRARALNGESFVSLQKELSGSAPGKVEPEVRIGPIACSALPEAHRQVCELRAGEVSEPIADSLGVYIYRIESCRKRSLDEVYSEINAKLRRDYLQAEIEKMRTPISLELDEAYFGKLPSRDVAHKHGMNFPNAKTVAGPNNQRAHDH